MGFRNFDIWPCGRLAQISMVWHLQKLYIWVLACAKGDFSKWLNLIVNLNNLNGVSEELFLVRIFTRNGIKTNSKSTNILASFQTRFALCTTTVISSIKSGLKCFLEGEGRGEWVLLVVRLVPYQTLHLKILAVIVMIKQML